jgi:hypothetical protein
MVRYDGGWGDGSGPAQGSVSCSGSWSLFWLAFASGSSRGVEDRDCERASLYMILEHSCARRGVR